MCSSVTVLDPTRHAKFLTQPVIEAVSPFSLTRHPPWSSSSNQFHVENYIPHPLPIESTDLSGSRTNLGRIFTTGHHCTVVVATTITSSSSSSSSSSSIHHQQHHHQCSRYHRYRHHHRHCLVSSPSRIWMCSYTAWTSHSSYTTVARHQVFEQSSRPVRCPQDSSSKHWWST